MGKSSHKSVDVNENFIMSLYYTKPVLFTMCVGNEVFYAALYLLHFTPGPISMFFNLIYIFWITSTLHIY